MEARGEPESQPQRKKISTYSTGDLANPDSKESLSKRFWKPYRRQGENTSTLVSVNKFYTLLPTANVTITNLSGQEAKARVLLDSGTKETSITQTCSNQLNLRRNAGYPITGLADIKTGLIKEAVDLAIRPENNIQGGDESYRFSSIHDLLYKGRM
ncbi:hypothetical protein AVEN_161673-1 [Araneus ventricosus]|uniref:Peptidase A2 domain-containing protein n=1 Tax=Araneus ventricosus TaxID=182803 RepID=A0A4Y2RE07_ARAVE|nr:hypothetical protein AVEN_161673-1 [Araneus ventricosus]